MIFQLLILVVFYILQIFNIIVFVWCHRLMLLMALEMQCIINQLINYFTIYMIKKNLMKEENIK